MVVTVVLAVLSLGLASGFVISVFDESASFEGSLGLFIGAFAATVALVLLHA